MTRDGKIVILMPQITYIANEEWVFTLCKDVKPSLKKSEFPWGIFFLSEIWSRTVPISLTLFALHYRFSLPCGHQNLINFEFLYKHRCLYLSLLLSCRNMEVVSFYDNKLWLRDGNGILEFSVSSLLCFFMWIPCLLCYSGKYKIPFQCHFFT